MKCANCDAEIKDGSIYCPVCGKEAQMVNGYTSLEDDFLHSLLQEGIKPQSKKRVSSPEEQLRIRKRKQAMPLILAGLLLAVLITVGVVIKIFVDYQNDNSYQYQMKMAQEEMVDHNYESALQHLKRALAIDPGDIECRMEMVDIYLIQKENDAAIVLLTEVIRLNKDEEAAYKKLIDIYAEQEQYEQIKQLSRYVEDEEIKKLFIDYLVAAPSIFPGGDTFYSELKVTIVSTEDDAIYYTTDGTDPITNGKRYIEGVGINFKTSGLYTVKAVCKNKKNIYSDVVKHDYQIILTPENETEVFMEEILEIAE